MAWYLTGQQVEQAFDVYADVMLLYTTQPIYDSLLAKGILIRNCENFRGLGEGYYRIAVKKHEENEVLLQELAQITAE